LAYCDREIYFFGVIRVQAGMVFAAPQRVIGQLRVDFGVFVNVVANEEVRIAVECDGRKFHEQEEHQVARDKGRDHYAQLAGWRPLRFTGSEIWRNAAKCATEVAALAKKASSQFSSKAARIFNQVVEFRG